MPFRNVAPKSHAAWTKWLSILAALGITLALPAQASTAAPLSLALSMEAANEAIGACAAKGYRVAVTIADLDGVIKVEARGDGSPIHSQRFSFRKAYTAVSMGPMFGVDTTSSLVKTISQFPQGLSNVQAGNTDLLFLPGAVLLKSGKEPVGAIGVSGAPSSLEDEACAQAATGKIQDRLDHSAKND
jgi:uncharacterized protein GlcG (DUF336 family)